MRPPETNTIYDSMDSAGRYAGVAGRGADLKEEPPVWKEAQGMVESMIGNHPMAACGLAIFAGIIIGCWIKRR